MDSINNNQSKNEIIPNALKINRIRCILAIVVCVAISILEQIAITNQILFEPSEIVQEVGWGTYRFFTILSNLVMGAISAMCIPFAVDGLRYQNYHLPRWYANLLFMGATGVTITFLLSLLVLSPMYGFYYIMVYSNSKLFHLICPLLSIILFLFINSDHNIKFKSSLIAIAPIVLYGIVYFIMVFVIGQEQGGWRDHYKVMDIMEYLPLPAIVILVFAMSLVVANLIRIPHNIIHERRKAALQTYYQKADPFDYPDIQSAIKALAEIELSKDLGGELTVPRRILGMMEDKYQSGLSIEEMCNLYIHAYYGDDSVAKIAE